MKFLGTFIYWMIVGAIANQPVPLMIPSVNDKVASITIYVPSFASSRGLCTSVKFSQSPSDPVASNRLWKTIISDHPARGGH
ncbi:hypothetical protein BDP27DRAFT_1426794 [Rhodocollybia butyracea]|uniref:Secreted protein n=1 Tax=Rhodocollybia butyracea TaxID=206335 RepID=A0A9P5U2H3_9AGAR|nr:hypothetical protein BDP27DRAFT_1426794 [Rhodocollybia butyracea]